MKTLLLIPAYNEENTIGALLDSLDAAGVREYADVMVVDDCSSDLTGMIARAHGAVTVRNIFNLGYGSALQLGYKYAVRRGYDHVIQMDADGQHDICNIPALQKALDTPLDSFGGRKPDIVIGSRFLKGSTTFPISGLKKVAIHLFSGLIKRITGRTILDPTSGLQGLSRPAFLYYSKYNQFNSRYPDANMIVQMLLHGFAVTEIPSVMHARETGISMHSGVLKPALYMIIMSVSIFAVTVREKERQRKLRASGKAEA